MRVFSPAIAVAVLTICVEWIAQQAHGPIWFCIFTATAIIAAAYLVYNRRAVEDVIAAVTDIVEEHAGRRLLTEYREYLVRALELVDQCNPDSPDLRGVWMGLDMVSKHLSRRLAKIEVQWPEFVDRAPATNDFDGMRQMIQRRIEITDIVLSNLAAP